MATTNNKHQTQQKAGKQKHDLTIKRHCWIFCTRDWMFAGTQMCERSDARNSPLRVKLRKIFLLLTTASQYEHITHVINTRTTCTEYVKNFGFIGIRIFLLIVLLSCRLKKQYHQLSLLLISLQLQSSTLDTNISKNFLNYVAIGFHPACSRTA